MSWQLKTPTFIPLGLLHYHSAGISREDALNYLLKSHESNPDLFPRIDYREVDFWYKSFQNKNFNLNQKPTYPALTNLENLPVLDQVIHGVNTADQQSLRKVSKRFRDFIDSENRLYAEIQLHLTSNAMMIQLKCGISHESTQMVYREKDKGCEVSKDNEKTQSDLNYMDAAFTDFKSAIEKLHTKVKDLVVKSDRKVTSENQMKFISAVTETLGSLKEPLHVESLFITFTTDTQLNSILEGIRPGSLSSLRFITDVYRNEEFDMEKIIQSSHWEHLQQLSIHTSEPIRMKIGSVVHIPSVFIPINNSVTAEELLIHKNKILQTPNFESHTFCIGNNQQMRKEWEEALKPYSPLEKFGKEDEISGSYQIPGEKNKRLAFSLTNAFIAFRKERNDYSFRS